MPHFFSHKGKKRYLTLEPGETIDSGKTEINRVSRYKTETTTKFFAGIFKKRKRPLKPERIAKIGANEPSFTNQFYKIQPCYPLSPFGKYQILLEERIPGIDGVSFYENFLQEQLLNTSTLKMILQLMLYAFYNLKLIHEKKLIHRDIKLDNLMIFKLYNPKTKCFETSLEIIDFEFARKVDAQNIEDNLGSQAYASPEAYEPGFNTQMFQSDIFSMGICLSDLLTGNSRVIKLSSQGKFEGFDFSKNTQLHPNIQEILCKNNKKEAYSALIRMINIMTQENAENRGDISIHFETLKNIYKAIYDEDFEPYYIPREKQTKLDKLTKTATRLAGLLYDERFRTEQWEDFFDVYRDQIARYSQPEKLNNVIPDSDSVYQEKRELFQLIANFVSEHASEQAIQDNICAIIDILHAIKTAENLIELKEKIAKVQDEALKIAIEPWLKEDVHRTPKL